MKNILHYQQLDSELVALEKQYDSLKEHEMLGKMSVLYKDMQSTLLTLEENAKKVSEEYDASFKQYQEYLNKTKSLNDAEITKLSDDDLAHNLESANKISSDLFMLERKLNLMITTINNTLKDFENAKNKLMYAKSKHAELKEFLEKAKAEMQPKTAKIEKELKSLVPTLDEKLFTRYKALKHDNVFPVFVPLNDKRCGYCRVELPSGKLDNLRSQDFIVCEQCGRLIYKD